MPVDQPVASRRRVHAAVCARCGGRATLSFRPRGDKPVYCTACFKSRQNGGPTLERSNRRRGATSPAVEAPAVAAVDAATIANTFPGLPLCDATRAALARMDIAQPTPIQAQTIPLLAAGHDAIGQARTGSGKTLAFAIPMVERCEATLPTVQALVLVPTRELAIQVASVIDALAKPQRIRVTLLYGGRSLEPERRALRSGAQIVVGTPGRTLDHLRQGTLLLGGVRMLVLDEADEMLDRGFAHDVEAILGETPTQRQTALFSATMPEWVSKTASRHLRDPRKVEVDAGVQAAPSVEHRIYNIDKASKLGALQTLLDHRGGAPIIVFGKTKHGVKKLAKQLEAQGYPVGALQGNLSQNARESVMRDFRSGKAPILVATNVAARGLDVEGIGQVINYDLPDSEHLFTHRIGRTGRMGRAGEAITFITPDEEKKWREIERALGRRFPRQPWAAHERARSAQGVVAGGRPH